ncbi:unannotated protein [freshwater metagenome]|uniref:Unannotated protein n=1 Tax=freshwater metagenome TaxID=449393 RepID=A0A6J7M5Y4_9ZZZZ
MFPRAEEFYAGEISLPIFPALDDEIVARVAESVKTAVMSQ